MWPSFRLLYHRIFEPSDPSEPGNRNRLSQASEYLSHPFRAISDSYEKVSTSLQNSTQWLRQRCLRGVERVFPSAPPAAALETASLALAADPREQRLKEVVAHLVARNPLLGGFTTYISLAPQTEINAFSQFYAQENVCRITVNEGAFDGSMGMVREDREEDMADMLAHELGHCLANFVDLRAESRIAKLSFSKREKHVLSFFGLNLTAANFQPQHLVEYAADLYGIALLMRSDFGASASLERWDWLRTRSQGPGLYSSPTHPSNIERYSMIRLWMDRMNETLVLKAHSPFATLQQKNIS